MALVSIIVPVYNNALSLSQLAERLNALTLAKPEHNFEFVYVDDGSRDDSVAVLERLAAKDARVRVIKLSRNFGSNIAILAGMTYSSGDCVGFISADLQEPPETLLEMLSHWEAGHKVVLAVRQDRRGDPLVTRFFAGIFNWLFKKLVFPGLSPQGVGFFLIDRQVADVLLQCDEKNAHLIGLVLWSGFQYSTVMYDRVSRPYGKSGWTFGKKLKYLIDAFTAFSYLPLRFSSALGLFLAAGGSIYALVIIVLRVLNLVTVPGWTALTVIVLLTSGTQLIMLGVIGEYLWRSFEATRNRPPFIVESLLGTISASSQEYEKADSAPALPGSPV
ncbi:MAG: glycosyltransferase family 2 protein [Anaerolineae bacterium]|nr:glycosyltransferase family 2 protein [Anaerolineae bacterium]